MTETVRGGKWGVERDFSQRFRNVKGYQTSDPRSRLRRGRGLKYETQVLTHTNTQRKQSR